ncbi:MAG: ATP-binding protein [Verrucomicrobiota bacterium]
MHRHLAGPEHVPGPCLALLQEVDAAYQEFDNDRIMLERSLELSSQELLQANAELVAIFGAIPDLLFRVDAAGRIISSKTGRHDEPLLANGVKIGQRIQDGVLGAAGPQFEAALRRAVEQRTLVTVEFPFRDRHYECRVVPVEGSEALIIVRNITERKQAEEALLAEQSRFRLVALATRDAIYDWNMVTGVIWRNEAFRALYGGGGEKDAEGLRWEDFVHPDDLLRLKQSLADTLCRRQQLWLQEYRLLRADGTQAYVMDRGYIHYDQDGRMLRMIGAMTDISEHRRLQEQLLQSQKMEAIGQLAGGVAHDFNNLLTVIQGNLSLVRECGVGGPEAAAPLEQCAQAAKRAANLTRQLLTFSRREQVSLKPLDLNAVVTEMTKMCRRLVGEHIQIETSYAPGRMPVLADAGSIEQVLMNLVVNSRDAMPQGGRLLIKTAPATVSAEAISHHPFGRPGSYVRLSVTDTGCGIPREFIPRIFEPFFTTKEAGKGTGLGLATVFGIVQQHRGWIEVDSQVHVGTTFHLYLPRQDEAVVADGSAPAQTAAPGGRESILVVEDEPMVRGWMAKLLTRYGYTVTVAASGQEAIRLFSQQEGRFDLVITDMVMPGGISGGDLGKSLKARKPGLKLLYCSGYSDEFFGGKHSLHGGSPLLAKPFEAPELLQRVREKLDMD